MILHRHSLHYLPIPKGGYFSKGCTFQIVKLKIVGPVGLHCLPIEGALTPLVHFFREVIIQEVVFFK